MTRRDWPAYPVAREAAELIHPRFAARLALAEGEQPSTHLPTPTDLEEMIDATFWASLRREEDFVPTISAAFLNPDAIRSPLRFEHPVPFAPVALARLSPAVMQPGVHLGVWRHGEDLEVWGIATWIPEHCFVVEVTSPGLLVLKESRGEETGKFANVAVLEGDRIKVVSDGPINLPDCMPMVKSLLASGFAGGPLSERSVVLELAVAMRRHGHGGSLIVVPSGRHAWRESVVPPILYSVSPSFHAFSGTPPAEAVERIIWKRGLYRMIDSVAGLTAVDGATIISDSYEVLAFGVKLGRHATGRRVERVKVSEPVAGSRPEVVHPTQLGGTRHLSAAQFAHDQRDSIALVASQDGRMTIFAWSPCERMVHARRIETLLR